MKVARALVLLSVVSIFSLIVVGAYVAAADFGGDCGYAVPSDWPLCQGNLLPPPQLGPIVEYMHRVLAAVSSLILVLAAVAVLRAKDFDRSARRLVLLSLALIFVQVIVGGVVIAQQLQAGLVAVHQGLAVLIFGLLVAAYVSGREEVANGPSR